MNICSFPCRHGCGHLITPEGPAGRAENDAAQAAHDESSCWVLLNVRSCPARCSPETCPFHGRCLGVGLLKSE